MQVDRPADPCPAPTDADPSTCADSASDSVPHAADARGLPAVELQARRSRRPYVRPRPNRREANDGSDMQGALRRAGHAHSRPSTDADAALNADASRHAKVELQSGPQHHASAVRA